jgi:hypothetical protein
MLPTYGRPPSTRLPTIGLSRRLKEALAFAVSMTTRSASGAELHLSQLRRSA